MTDALAIKKKQGGWGGGRGEKRSYHRTLKKKQHSRPTVLLLSDPFFPMGTSQSRRGLGKYLMAARSPPPRPWAVGSARCPFTLCPPQHLMRGFGKRSKKRVPAAASANCELQPWGTALGMRCSLQIRAGAAELLIEPCMPGPAVHASSGLLEGRVQVTLCS